MLPLAALVPDGSQWTALGYCPRPHPVAGRSGWLPYAEANVAFRASPLAGGPGEGTVAQSVENALAQLRPSLAGMPYVVFLPGEPSHIVWPWLANKNLDRVPAKAGRIDGKVPLPGYGLPVGQQPTAVVRITVGPDESPRPIGAINVSNGKFKRTTRALYEVCTEGPGNVWILSNVPRQFDGGGIHSRLGNSYSRWRARPDELSQPPGVPTQRRS